MKKAVLLLIALSLTACSSRYATNGESIYLHSKNGKLITVPRSLTSDSISHFYDLPQQTQSAKVNIEPPQGE